MAVLEAALEAVPAGAGVSARAGTTVRDSRGERLNAPPSPCIREKSFPHKAYAICADAVVSPGPMERAQAAGFTGCLHTRH